MPAFSIDIRDYTTLPHLDVPRAIALGRALLAAAPDQQPKLARRARKALEDWLAALEAAWQPARHTAPTQSKRPADSAVDNTWGGLSERLAAWRRLDPERVPQAARAAELHLLLFPTGLDFVTLAYDKQWAESERRLRLIEERQLAGDLDALAGAPFLAELRAAHATYGEVLGITAPAAPSQPPAAALNEPLREVRLAIRDWVTRLVGTVDDEDPEAVAAVRAALRPIDELRASLAGKSASTPAEVQPTEPDREPEPVA